MKEPISSVRMNDFPGMITGVDARDVPPGAAVEQVNAKSERVGELAVRAGWRVVRFEGDD